MADALVWYSGNFSRWSRRALGVVAIAVVALALPAAQSQGQFEDLEAERAALRSRQALVASELDTLVATDAEIGAALEALNVNVAAQVLDVTAAQHASEQAKARLDEATAAAAAAQAQFDDLSGRLSRQAVGLYVRPVSDEVLRTVIENDPENGPATRARIRLQLEDVAQLVAEVRHTKELLVVAEGAAAAQRRATEQVRLAQDAKLVDLQKALSLQNDLSVKVQARMAATRAEANQLTERDQQVAKEIERRQAELAARLAEEKRVAAEAARQAAADAARRAAEFVVAGDAAGTRTVTATAGAGAAARVLAATNIPGAVRTTWVRDIEVASEIAPAVEAMVAAAGQDGVLLKGSGYRSTAEQIAIRRAVCGPTDYDIWDKPSSACSPPVARPGYSMHERGLAIDFEVQDDLMRNANHPAFLWLAKNAAKFGFYNLPSEPWHWSVNGR